MNEQQQQQQIPLHRDILVNYRQPLPPINPDSEYISHPQVVRPHIAYSPIYRANPYQRPLPPQLTATGEQDGLYYIAPKYRRSNNSNNGNGRSSSDSDNNSNNSDNDKEAESERSQSNRADESQAKANTKTHTSTSKRDSNTNSNGNTK
uniref:Uncharacterized protein n=1 Tax=Ceratitis capitata TaxID=7213 RepID=W8B6F1_CERCA